MRWVVALSLVALSCVASVLADGVGDRLIRGYTKYDTLPTTTLQAAQMGWSPLTVKTCQPGLGIQYTLDAGVVKTAHPLTLYYTQAGQISAMGMYVFGAVTAPPNFYFPIAKNQYLITLSFRNSSAICNGNVTYPTLPIGDQVVINQGQPAFAQALPLTTQGLAGNWTKGSCFETMGTHYFYDVKANPKPGMTWVAENLLPIVPMYNNGRLNAIFFASDSVQQGLSPNMWDGIPLPNLLMCKNWCDSKCTFSGTYFWSTAHIYFWDYTQVKCPGGCTISCCPGQQQSPQEQLELQQMMRMMHGGEHSNTTNTGH